MPWVQFTRDFDWKVNAHAVIAYKAGKRNLVSQECAKAAIAAGKAVPAPRKERSHEGR